MDKVLLILTLLFFFIIVTNPELKIDSLWLWVWRAVLEFSCV
jgi:hypothetical protein